MDLPQPILDSLPLNSLLRGLDAADRRRLLAWAVPLKRAAGAPLMEQGAPGDSLQILIAGTAKVCTVLATGREVVLDILRPGAVLGELAVFDEAPRAASVIATEPCEILSVHRSAVLSLMRDRPEMALSLLRLLSARLRATNHRIEDSSLGVPVRLARGLLRLAYDHGRAEGESLSLPFKLNQSTLAGLVSLSREKTNRQLRLWAEDGLIALERGQVRILDEAALTGLSEGVE